MFISTRLPIGNVPVVPGQAKKKGRTCTNFPWVSFTLVYLKGSG